MQIISNISKSLALVLLLGCSILVTCTNLTLEATDLGLIEPFATSTTRTANDIWGNISREFALNHQTQSARVQAEIRKLAADPKRFYDILKAAGPYIYYIYKQTHARGLPMELALIPFIESEFNPNDHSNKGATGLWQLMPQTARDLGVTVKGGYDGRRNLIASTNAALAFFNDLGNNFKGNWYLAIAAYNCGPGCVQHAERKTGTQDFWQLPVPKETKLYVPRLLAVAAMIENPEKYGVQLPTVDNAPYFKSVQVDKQQSIEKVAQASGVPVKTLTKLNPDAKSGTLPTTKEGKPMLLVPIRNVIEPADVAKSKVKTGMHQVIKAAPKAVAKTKKKSKHTSKAVHTKKTTHRKSHH